MVVVQAASAAERRIIQCERVERALAISPFDAAILADSATATIESYCGRVFAAQTYSERVAGRNSPHLWLSQGPIIEVVEITSEAAIPEYEIPVWPPQLYATDGNWIEDTQYSTMIAPGPSYGQPVKRNYTVEYRAGYEIIPADLADIALQIALIQHGNHQGNPALTSESIGDYSYSKSSMIGGASFPAHIANALKRYRLRI